MRNSIITLLTCLVITSFGVTGIISDKWVEPREVTQFSFKRSFKHFRYDYNNIIVRQNNN